MTETRIVGYVMARDEWPLLALAITHALMNHVDHVLVLDHDSGEETQAGLERLAGDWPGGVTVVRLEDPDYYQEAATTLMSCVGGFVSYDWVYVFDADEFLLTPPGSGLGDVLAEVPSDVDLVRYPGPQLGSPKHLRRRRPWTLRRDQASRATERPSIRARGDPGR